MPERPTDRPLDSTPSLQSWRHGESDSFDRLVAISAWLLLVIYDEESDQDDPKGRLVSWGMWKRLESFDDEDFHAALDEVVFPSLVKVYSGSGHPLALVAEALQGIPNGPLRSMQARASDCLEPGTLEEIFAIWQHWDIGAEPYAEQHGLAQSWEVNPLLTGVLAPSSSEGFVDFFPGTGGAAGIAAGKASSICLIQPDAKLGVVAAASVLLQGQHRNRVKVLRSGPNLRPSDGFLADVIIATPPWGASLPIGNRRARSELAALETVMASLADGGRAAVYLPHSFLFGGGKRRELRERLLGEFCVDALLNIPASKGAPLRPRGAILYFRKAAPRQFIWIIPEDEYADITCGEVDDPEEQALKAALQARLGIAPRKRLPNGEFLDFKSWLGKIESEIAGPGFDPSDPDQVRDETYGSRMISLAKAFHRGAQDAEVGTRNLVPIEEIARRDFELILKSADWSDYERYLDKVRKTPGGSVVSLGEIATVRRGSKLGSNQLSRDVKMTDGSMSVSYLRVSDIPNNFKTNRLIFHANTKVVPEVVESLSNDSYAKDGDIVLSIDGTIGKSAVMNHEVEFGFGPARIVPSQGLALIRLKESSPPLRRLVADILMSEPYRQLLSSRSVGSTVRHLRISDLRAIQIPILPPAERVRLLEVLPQATTFASLIDAIDSREGYTRALKRLLELPEWLAFTRSEPAGSIEHEHLLLKSLVAVSNPTAKPPGDSEDPYFHWTSEFSKAASNLDEILDYPRSTDQLAALQGWRNGVRDHSRAFRSSWEILRQKHRLSTDDDLGVRLSRAIFERCEKLFSRLWQLAIRASDDLLDDVSVTATVGPTEFLAGREVEGTLSVMNHGPLPLRNFRIGGDGVEESTLTLLRSGSASTWGLRLAPQEPGKVTLRFRWSAQCLNEATATGSLEIAVTATTSGDDAPPTDLGHSPYVYARVLDEKSEDVFKGRRKPIQDILAAIDRPSASTIVLVEGNRRIGKTSLLKYFIRHHLPESKVAVFVNFQEFDGETGSEARPGIPTLNVYRGMTRELVKAAVAVIPNLELPKIGPAPTGNRFALIDFCEKAERLIDSEAPFQSFRQLAEVIREAIHPRSLLLILDEFDRLQEGIESGVTSDQVPENLRHLFQTWNDVSGIFTGSRTIRRLRQEYWNILFGLGQTVRLSGLDPDEARQLIEAPVEGRLVYASNAVEEISRLTARQPLLIQGICDRLFRISKESGQRSIGLSLVEQVASEIAADSEHFESIWTYIGSNRRRLLVFMIDEQERVTGGATFERIQELLEENGLTPPVRELRADLDELEDLEVIHPEIRS